MIFRFFNILTILIFLTCPVWAADNLTAINPPPAKTPAITMAPFNMKGIYNFSFSGVNIGKMGLEIAQTAQNYAITGDITTTGLLKIFVSHSSHTTVAASGKDFSYSAIDYQTHYQTRKKKKSIKMRYKDGAIVEEQMVPPDNHATRPAVPDALKKGASDPLSLILKIRQGVLEAQQNNNPEFTLNAYDGRRLTQIYFNIIGKKTISYQGTPVPVIDVGVKRKYIAGFTQAEIEEKPAVEPLLHIYFRDDATLMPLRLEVSLWMGTLAATLSRECAAGESCLLGIKD